MRTGTFGWGALAVVGLMSVGCDRSDGEKKAGAPAPVPAPVAASAGEADGEGRKHEGESMGGMNPGASGSAAKAGAAADGTGAVDGEKGDESATAMAAPAAPGVSEDESTYDSVLPRDSVATLSGQDRAVRAARPKSENTTGARFEITSMSGEEVVLRPLDETTEASRDNVAGYEVTMPRAEFDQLIGTPATPVRTGLRLTLTRDGTGKATRIALD